MKPKGKSQKGERKKMCKNQTQPKLVISPLDVLPYPLVDHETSNVLYKYRIAGVSLNEK